MEDPQKMTDNELLSAINAHDDGVNSLQRRVDEADRAAAHLLKEQALRNEEREAREALPKLNAALLSELRPVFEAAAAHDQALVEYHGRRLGLELLPLHGRSTR